MKNILKSWPISSVLLIILLFPAWWGGCASIKNSGDKITDVTTTEGHPAGTDVDTEEKPPRVEIREFILSSGDEIAISVLGHQELNKRLVLPPNGRIFFPLVGEIDVKGRTLRQLQKDVTEGLSKYHKLTVSPGDEIQINVYRNDDLNRRFIIPPDGRFFYPLTGEIDTTDKTYSQIQGIISDGLSRFMIEPQVSVSMVSSTSPKVIDDPQVSVEVVAYGGQKVFVLGEVSRPGVFTLESGIDLVEAVSRAGGFTLDARKESILVIRGGLKNPDLQLFNIQKFLKGGDLSQNVSLQRGDIVYVPASTIANVDRFFRHFETIINPIVTLETGIVLAPGVEDAFTGKTQGSTVIVPPR